MQEFWKSVKIRQSYHEKFDAPFFWDTVYYEIAFCPDATQSHHLFKTS